MTVTVLHKIDREVLTYTNQVVEYLKETFSWYYVLDIIEKQKNNQTEMDIVEVNSIHCSGLYLYNSMMNQRLDILHQNIWILPEEWKENKEEYKLEGMMIEYRENLYDCKDSFSSDVRNIYLTGLRE